MPQTTIPLGMGLSGFAYGNLRNQDIIVSVEIYKLTSNESCIYTELGETQITLTHADIEEYKANSNDPQDAFFSFNSFFLVRQISVYCRTNYSSQQENPSVKIEANQLQLKKN